MESTPNAQGSLFNRMPDHLPTVYKNEETLFIYRKCSYISCLVYSVQNATNTHNTTQYISVVKSLMLSNYNKFKEDGIFALFSSPPVLYMTEEDSNKYRPYLQSRLHLPGGCVREVPYTPSMSTNKTLCLKFLERMIGEDLECGKKPLLVVANLGFF